MSPREKPKSADLQRQPTAEHFKIARARALKFSAKRKLTLDATEELLAEANVGLMRALHSWDISRGPLEPWIIMKVDYHLIDYVRDKATHVKRLKAGETVPRMERLDEETLPAPVLEEDATDVMRLLRRLPAREGLILRRRILDGATLQEIGWELDISPSRVSQLSKRGSALVRSMLGGDTEWPPRAPIGRHVGAGPRAITERQAQFLSLAAKGLSASEISKRFNCSETNVYHAWRRAARRLGASGLVNTVYVATRDGHI